MVAIAREKTIKGWLRAKKIGLIEHDFSIEKGELTPTQKVKRRAIDKNYKKLIDSLYDEAERSGITDSHAIV